MKDNDVPYSVATARRISVPMLSKVRMELERMVQCAGIEEIKEPTELCAQFTRRTGRLGYVWTSNS